MSDQIIPVPQSALAKTHATDAAYRSMYAAAVADPEAFWGVQGRRIDWIKPYSKVKDTSFKRDDFRIRWY